MKDIYSLIRQKEADLERIQHEIEALRLSARLLEESDRPISAAGVGPAPAYNAPPKPQAPAAAPSAWAAAKQFP